MAALKIKERWNHVEIVGYRDGYFSNDQIPLIRDEVQRAEPTLLLIGLGSPRQEEVALEFLQVPDLQARMDRRRPFRFYVRPDQTRTLHRAQRFALNGCFEFTWSRGDLPFDISSMPCGLPNLALTNGWSC